MRLEISLGVRRVRVWCAQWLVLVPISRSCSIILLGPPALPWRHPFFCSATRCHRMAQGAGPRAAAAKGQAAAEYAERVLVMAQSCTSFPRTNGSPRPPAQPRSQGARLFAAHRQRRCAHHHRLERTAQQPSAATSSDGASSSGGNVPWGFGFQLNERYLEWDPEGAAAAQLIKLTLVNTLGLSVEEVEARLEVLGRLVPDIQGKLPRMRADILAQLIRDPQKTTRHLLGLRELLPNTNVSQLVTRWPFIMLDFSLETLQERFQTMSGQLPGVNVEALVDLEPQMLRADLPVVLANIKRIMPTHDPIAILVAQPQMVLDMQQAGLSSALDVEGIPSTQ